MRLDGAAFDYVSLVVAIPARLLEDFAVAMSQQLPLNLAMLACVGAPNTAPPHSFHPRYRLTMQAAMTCGFATSFPMNRPLIDIGWKEKR